MPDGPVVTLREITFETVRAICALKVTDAQNAFVAPNAVSIAQAHFSEYAWFRAIYANDEPAGFLMLYDDPAKPEYFLWRFMIDERFQRQGIGREAMKLLIEHVRTRPDATVFQTSVVQAPGGPQPFYESLGFIATGEIDDDEAVLELTL